MHSDPAAIQKAMRTYFMVGGALLIGTVITVGANQLHLTGAIAITVALIIAGTKGTLVASIFMHLNHEKKWIYGSLALTVFFFIVILALPVLTHNDTIGAWTKWVPADVAEKVKAAIN